MVYVDGAFRMGSAHQVCQDYVAAVAGEFPCVVLADGCSGSPDTDCGARLLVRSAQSFVSGLIGEWEEVCSGAKMETSFAACLEQYHFAAVTQARSHAEGLNLSAMSIDATLLTLAANDERWFASVFGDGVVVACRADGRWEVTVFSYPGGYPFYPNYLADAERRRSLLCHSDDLRQAEQFVIAADGGVEDRRQETQAMDAPCPFVQGGTSDYEWVAILSDGVHSFSRRWSEAEGAGASRANTPLPLKDALAALLAFKSLRGQFVQRRVQRFEQQCRSQGWQHHDDLSIGAMSLHHKALSDNVGKS